MEQWNGGVFLETFNGMMEYWVLKMDFILFLICFTSGIEKKDFILLNPLFQSSIIPRHRSSA